MGKESIKKSLKIGLISGCIAFLILISLQPFGIDRVEDNKLLLVLGYGIIAFFWVTIINLLSCAIGWGHTKMTELNWKLVVLQIVTIIAMGSSISCYAAWYFTGNIKYGFFDGEGNLHWKSFAINCGYAFMISIIIDVILYLTEKNKDIKGELEAERLMNQRIMQQLEAKANSNENDEPAEKITITGTTKESLSIVPGKIIYAVSDSNYLDVVYLNDENKATKKSLRLTMKQIEEQLSGCKDIIRCHRAYMVNTKMVSHVDGNAQGYKLQMQHTEEVVPVSRAYATEIYEKITE